MQDRGGHDGLLVFDNGVRRSWSRVLEVEPLRERVVWSYGEKEGEKFFYSRARGSSQRLPNGNTLIALSEEGEAIEVTPDGRRVWQEI